MGVVNGHEIHLVSFHPENCIKLLAWIHHETGWTMVDIFNREKPFNSSTIASQQSAYFFLGMFSSQLKQTVVYPAGYLKAMFQELFFNHGCQPMMSANIAASAIAELASSRSLR